VAISQKGKGKKMAEKIEISRPPDDRDALDREGGLKASTGLQRQNALRYRKNEERAAEVASARYKESRSCEASRERRRQRLPFSVSRRKRSGSGSTTTRPARSTPSTSTSGPPFAPEIHEQEKQAYLERRLAAMFVGQQARPNRQTATICETIPGLVVR
jgi:hypothetical protein